MRKYLLIWTGVLAMGAASASWAEGTLSPLRVPLHGDRIQGRIAFGTLASPSLGDSLGADAAPRLSSVSFIGDYYLRPSVGTSLSELAPTGFRATTGLMLGKRSSLWGLSTSSSLALVNDRRNGVDGMPESHSTPYLGIGYTGAGGKGSWGLTADLGVMSLSPGSVVRFGKVFNGSQNLDDMVRDLRLSPVLQLGISYSF